MSNGNWFWHSALMNWVERSLLDLTNWVWKKRHVTSSYTKPAAKKVATAPAKKTVVKKPATKKKTDWNVK